MPNSLRDIFTPEILNAWSAERRPTRLLGYRVNVLTAHGPLPGDEPTRRAARYWRAARAAWDAYVTAASACGLFDGKHRADLLARLRSADDGQFRSGMAECMACWFLAGKLKLSVKPRPADAAGKVPDLAVAAPEGNITVEVKAPYKEPIEQGMFVGDDAPMLAAALDEANRQFERGGRNVSLLFATTKMGVPSRRELIHAFFGETKIVVPLAREIGGTGGDARTAFFPEGKFLKIWKDTPRFTRTSAVVSLMEKLVEDQGDVLPQNVWVDHRWLVLHNPFSTNPVSSGLWGNCPQLVRDGDVMRWSDGKPIDG